MSRITTSRRPLSPIRSFSPSRGLRAALLLVALLAPTLAVAAPSLDSDQRIISAFVDPPFGPPPNEATPVLPFDPFSDLVNMGGSLMCPMVPSDSSSSAAQDSTVAPLAFAGTGSAAFNIEAGDCSGGFADVKSIYEITFTTYTTNEFEFDATLANANVLLENDDSTSLMSWTAHTGVAGDLQTLPPDTYTIRVDVSLLENISSMNSASDSGSYDFMLTLTPDPLPVKNVATQDVARANASLHLLNLGPPNSIAHGEVDTNHITSSIATFNSATLAGIDIVYLSPAQVGQLGLTVGEIDALVTFVHNGGHLILPADNAGADWYQEFVEIAAAFDGGYTGVSDFETSATIFEHGFPQTDGPGGLVTSYAVGPPHQSGLTSSEEDFVTVAKYSTGAIAMGYLPPVGMRLGHVTFLTDFNTFGDSQIILLDSGALWTNLFSVPEPAGAAPLSIALLFLSLAERSVRRRQRSTRVRPPPR